MKTTKTIKLLMSIVLTCAVIVALDSCKGGGEDPAPEETESERVSKLLTTSPWKLNTLTVDGVAKSTYAGMTIAFANGTYTATKGEPVWPSSGSWSFSDATAKAINRADQVTIDIDAIDATALTLSLTWTKTTMGPGRAQSTAGKHVFVFGK
jgi:hypothetical protein